MDEAIDHPPARNSTTDGTGSGDASSATMEPTGDQGETVTLTGVLDRFEAAGFAGQMGERDGLIRCFTCRHDSDPADVEVAHVRRLEGASDPADMLAVFALTCPKCGTAGTLTLNYGPESTPGEVVVLQAVEVGAKKHSSPGLSPPAPG